MAPTHTIDGREWIEYARSDGRVALAAADTVGYGPADLARVRMVVTEMWLEVHREDTEDAEQDNP